MNFLNKSINAFNAIKHVLVQLGFITFLRLLDGQMYSTCNVVTYYNKISKDYRILQNKNQYFESYDYHKVGVSNISSISAIQ